MMETLKKFLVVVAVAGIVCPVVAQESTDKTPVEQVNDAVEVSEDEAATKGLELYQSMKQNGETPSAEFTAKVSSLLGSQGQPGKAMELIEYRKANTETPLAAIVLNTYVRKLKFYKGETSRALDLLQNRIEQERQNNPAAPDVLVQRYSTLQRDTGNHDKAWNMVSEAVSRHRAEGETVPNRVFVEYKILLKHRGETQKVADECYDRIVNNIDSLSANEVSDLYDDLVDRQRDAYNRETWKQKLKTLNDLIGSKYDTAARNDSDNVGEWKSIYSSVRRQWDIVTAMQ